MKTDETEPSDALRIDDVIAGARLGRVWTLAASIADIQDPTDPEDVAGAMLDALVVAIAAEEAILTGGNVLLRHGGVVYFQPGMRTDCFTVGFDAPEVQGGE